MKKIITETDRGVPFWVFAVAIAAVALLIALCS
jgi:hypothetical protein